MDDKFDVIVIGAGVIGMAVARALAMAGKQTLLLEKNAHFGMETSSRNSEVIHAGIYYPTGSLKAELCVEGKHRLYEFLAAKNIARKACGKLIIAQSSDEINKLAALKSKAEDNGVDDLTFLTAGDVSDLEPAVSAHFALLSPSTGVFDSHHFMDAVLFDMEEAGGLYFHDHRILTIGQSAVGFQVEIETSDGEQFAVGTEAVVNAAGLYAPDIAGAIDGLDDAHIPTYRFAKGHYIGYSDRGVFGRHIYPLPSDGGLGVHATIGIDGAVKFGPDILWDVAREDVRVSDDITDGFFESVRNWFPAAERAKMFADYAGIRPKLHGPREPVADFRIDGPEVHAISGLINLFGIESPGLTASLAIAEKVLAMLDRYC